jgi:hypothetical protein
LLDLGQRANQLFKTANPLHQQQILKGVVYNVEMFDQKLSYSLINCYEAFKQLNEQATNGLNEANWCYARDTLIASAEEYEDSIQLQELVSTFNLSGSLLAV